MLLPQDKQGAADPKHDLPRKDGTMSEVSNKVGLPYLPHSLFVFDYHNLYPNPSGLQLLLTKLSHYVHFHSIINKQKPIIIITVCIDPYNSMHIFYCVMYTLATSILHVTGVEPINWLLLVMVLTMI